MESGIADTVAALYAAGQMKHTVGEAKAHFARKYYIVKTRGVKALCHTDAGPVAVAPVGFKSRYFCFCQTAISHNVEL